MNTVKKNGALKKENNILNLFIKLRQRTEMSYYPPKILLERIFIL